MILLDQPDTHWIFIGCIHWSAWQFIQYCLEDTVGSAGYPPNIHWVYILVGMTVHPILSGWYCRISWIPTEYPPGVSTVLVSLTVWQSIQYYLGDTVGSAGYPMNIHWVYLLVSLTVHPILSGWYCRMRQICHWIFIGCIYWLAWQSIQYHLDDTVGSVGYPTNVHWAYLFITLTVRPILSG